MSLFKFLFRRRPRKRSLPLPPPLDANEKLFRERVELLTVMALLMQRP